MDSETVFVKGSEYYSIGSCAGQPEAEGPSHDHNGHEALKRDLSLSAL